MLEIYATIEVDGKQYVRKERLDELQQQFDSVCHAHTEFVNQVYAGIMRAKAEGRLLPAVKAVSSNGNGRHA